MSQFDEWEEWRRVYACLPRTERRELYWGALYTAMRRRAAAGSGLSLGPGGLWQPLRLFLGSFPSGVALVHGVLMLLMLCLLPPVPQTPPALLGISYVLSLNTAVWLWWGARRVWRWAG